MHPLLTQYRLISDQVTPHELTVILQKLEYILDSQLEGDIVEMGCYVGTTSLFIRRVMNERHTDKAFHVYDSFAGLPEKVAHDSSAAGDQFKAGELLAKKSQFVTNFKKANLRLPVVHKGWFHELAAEDVPNKIAFAFLDGDYYESIHDSLKLVWPKLVPGAVVIIDDYQNEALPGAAKAADQWLQTYSNIKRHTVVHSLLVVEVL